MKSHRKIGKTFSDPEGFTASDGADRDLQDHRVQERRMSNDTDQDAGTHIRNAFGRPKSSKGKQRQPAGHMKLADSDRSSPTSITSSTRGSPTTLDKDDQSGHKLLTSRPKSGKGRTRGGYSRGDLPADAQSKVTGRMRDETDDALDEWNDGDDDDDDDDDNDDVVELMNKEGGMRPKSSKGRARDGNLAKDLASTEDGSDDQDTNKPSHVREGSTISERPKSSWIAGRRNPRFTDGIPTAEELDKELDFEIENFNIRETSDADEASDVSYEDSDDELSLYANSLLTKSKPVTQRNGDENTVEIDLGCEPITTRSDEINPRSLRIQIPTTTRRTSIADLQYDTAREKVLEKYGRSLRQDEPSSRGPALPTKLKPIKHPNGAVKTSAEHGPNGALSGPVDVTTSSRVKNVKNTDSKNIFKHSSPADESRNNGKHKARPLMGKKGKQLMKDSGMRERQAQNKDDRFDEESLASCDSTRSGAFMKRSNSDRVKPAMKPRTQRGSKAKQENTYGEKKHSSSSVLERKKRSISLGSDWSVAQSVCRDAELNETFEDRSDEDLPKNQRKPVSGDTSGKGLVSKFHSHRDVLDITDDIYKENINGEPGEILESELSDSSSKKGNHFGRSNRHSSEVNFLQDELSSTKENVKNRLQNGRTLVEKVGNRPSVKSKHIISTKDLHTKSGRDNTNSNDLTNRRTTKVDDSWSKQSISQMWQVTQGSRHKV